jgi:hypothetical protein
VNALLLASHRGDGGVVFVGMLVFIGILIFVGIMKNLARTDNLEGAARRFGGTVIPSFWGSNRLEFSVDGIPGELTYQVASRSRRPFTRVRFRYTPPGILRVATEGVFETLRGLLDAQAIEVGDAAFDRAFGVRGSPVGWVREVLDPEARWRLGSLVRLGASWWGGGQVSLEAGPGGVTLRCGRNFVDDRRELGAFLEESIALLRQIRTPHAEGITILSAEERVDRGECPVCAQPLGEGTRRCRGCGTLHHEDCWDYFGGCAIYACSRQGGGPG